MPDLTGKTALVTGASRGIGRAVALGLARSGADVAVLSRSAEPLESLAEEIRALGRRSVVLPCDVTDREAVARSVAAVLAEFGTLDILVNNAGGASHYGPFLELRSEDWDDVIDLNLRSVVAFSTAVGRVMVERGQGSIVTVAAASGISGYPMLSHYSASKAAVIHLTKTVASEWAANGVRINAVAPGWIETDLTSSLVDNPALGDSVISGVPAGRWGTADEVVGAVVFLASDDSSFITGSTLAIDGGLTAQAGGPAVLGLLPLGRVAS